MTSIVDDNQNFLASVIKKVRFSKNGFSNISKRYQLKLRAQLILVLILLSLLPLFVFGVFSFTTILRQVETQKEKALINYAEGTSGIAEAQIYSVQNLINGLSAHSDIRLLLENYNRNSDAIDTSKINSVAYTFKNVIDNSKGLYETIYLISLDGNVALDGSKYSKYYEGKSFYDKTDFAKLIKDGVTIIGSPVKSEATGRLLIPISSPIGMITSTQRSAASIMGAITVMYDLERFTENFSNGEIGKTGQVFVINSKNTIIYNSSHDNTNTIINDISYSDSNELKPFAYLNSSVEKVAARKIVDNADWNILVQMDSKEYYKEKNSFTFFIWIVFILILVLATITAIIYSRHITKPIEALINSMEKTQKGDLKVYSNDSSKIFEMQKLNNGFNAMIDNLAKIIEEVKATSNKVFESAREMTSIAQDSLSQAEETVNAVENINIGISRQSSSTVSANKGIDELSDMVDTAKGFSKDIKANSGNILSVVENGLSAAETLEEKWQYNKMSMAQVYNSINLLSDDILNINDIVTTISTITKKTKLLSLNASIEASRAGEAGRGFSVVADHIKNLSENTQDEVKVIDKIVNDIINRTNMLLKSMKEAEKSEAEQNSSVIATKASLGNIYNLIRDIDEKINNISLYLENVSSHKDEITDLVSHINNASQKVLKESAAIDEYVRIQEKVLRKVSSEADNLTADAENLIKTVVNFNV